MVGLAAQEKEHTNGGGRDPLGGGLGSSGSDSGHCDCLTTTINFSVDKRVARMEWYSSSWHEIAGEYVMHERPQGVVRSVGSRCTPVISLTILSHRS